MLKNNVMFFISHVFSSIIAIFWQARTRRQMERGILLLFACEYEQNLVEKGKYQLI